MLQIIYYIVKNSIFIFKIRHSYGSLDDNYSQSYNEFKLLIRKLIIYCLCHVKTLAWLLPREIRKSHSYFCLWIKGIDISNLYVAYTQLGTGDLPKSFHSI